MNSKELPAFSAPNIPNNRRGFLMKLGLATTAAATGFAATSQRAMADEAMAAAAAGLSDTDVAVLNFALNLEYLEAEYYLLGTTGKGLENAGIDVDGSGKSMAGRVISKKQPKVPFQTNAFEDYANEIAIDEANHVRFIRETLSGAGATVVARPVIDLRSSFKTLGSLVGVDNFDPFDNELNFLIGAFIFEDVGVSAYRGASPLVDNKKVLSAAAGILGVEAYHAGIIRTLLYAQGPDIRKLVGKISKVRASLDNKPKGIRLDQGITRNGMANLVAADDANSIAFSRSTRQVLNIVYGGADAESGLFFPKGLNGAIR